MSSHCRSCMAPLEWAVAPSGSKLPIDPDLVTGRDPRPMDVVLHVRSRRGFIVSAEVLKNGDVDRWLERPDCELRTSHWETCAGAVNHRDGGVPEGQERMEL